MIELPTVEDLTHAAEDDALLLWAAQGLRGGARAFRHGGAVAVASPGLSGRDRIAVRGPLSDAVPLVRGVLDRCGPSYRPLGDRALLAELAEPVGHRYLGSFGWMSVTGSLSPATGAAAARWLTPAELPEAAALLDRHFASSYAHPGRPGATAWAGVRDEADRLTAIAADAWSSPEVGLLAGVATDPSHGRGRGHAEAACRLVLDTQLRRSGRAALLVDSWNTAAIRLYRRLGLEWREIAACAA
ncbi:GNAT superfamily N-acetyltransferase [Kitasatospora gansuensis]|uniref:GNAT superfamily N-acetyltransferase n=1 Tax=Kitasatospora gansuensis TaxID=258050 RepID=A0A7W7WHF8_9ACTN|nr:GNAT family N-acetyltransferase [Kitasatospora gansuensis]MBB4946499.1 GNAT superfamily N-acetyltransferase [Kitasatospora gansuensis]